MLNANKLYFNERSKIVKILLEGLHWKYFNPALIDKQTLDQFVEQRGR